MIDVEQLRPDGYGAKADLRRMAFGDTGGHDPDAPVVSEDRHSCVYDGERLIAVAHARAFAQWFGGRAIPCGGVSGVMIATDHRGRGLGRAVVTDALENMRDRGEPISSLFPTTASLYRSLGYEIGGTYAIHRIPIADLPESDGSLEWESSTWDAVDVRSVANRAGLHHDGWLVRPEVDWQWAEHRRRKDAVSADVYVGRRDGAPVAVATIEYGPSADALFALSSPTLVGVDPGATAQALAFLGRHGTTASQADVKIPERVLHAHIEHPQRIRQIMALPWMTRIVDLPVALAARGWNPAAAVVLDLDVTDDLIPANTGRWHIEIADGKAAVEPGGGGAVRLDVNAVAGWFTGHATPAALHRHGRLVADEPSDIDAMALATAGAEPPTVTDFF